MLATIGVASTDDLFREIPSDLLIKGDLDVPNAMDEYRLMQHLAGLASKNVHAGTTTCFLGAGIYDRYIPAAVGAVLSRGEFLTAYTPYQPEVSQGYLQTIYEFQSMIAELYESEIANASMYDGATALAEAALMACSIKGKDKIILSPAIHPHYKAVVETYCWSMNVEIVEAEIDSDGKTVWPEGADAAGVLVQYPNFYGIVEDLKEARSYADQSGALLIVCADPIACALLPGPGKFGADIVVGEGQSLGVPMGYGGPLLGLFACKREFVRSIPGRIVGVTTDEQGRTGYTMTLRTREQDIRREKATSNICTNEALMALAATVYLSCMGANGMKSVASSSADNARYCADKLVEIGGKLRFSGPFFQEFVIDLPVAAKPVHEKLIERGILAGLPLGDYGAEFDNSLLIATTEIRTKQEIDDLASNLQEVLR